jgi:hypothetical protein
MKKRGSSDTTEPYIICDKCNLYMSLNVHETGIQGKRVSGIHFSVTQKIQRKLLRMISEQLIGIDMEGRKQ